MAAGEVKLLTMWVSPFGQRVKLALEVKGVEYEEVEEALHPKSDLLLRSNPIHKKIPVLIHNAKPVCESRIIMEYVDEVWPAPHRLLPEDPYQRALARFWADYADNKLAAAVLGVLMKAGEEQEKAKAGAREGLVGMEAGLAAMNPAGEHPFFGGEHPGFVDLVVAPFLAPLRASKAIAGFEVDWQECPRLVRWAGAVESHPVVRRCCPDAAQLVDFVGRVRKERLQA